MKSNRVLRFVLMAGFFWALLVLLNLLFPVILNSKVLFGGLVILLFIGGMVMAAIAIREMGSR